jgi:hypothetical protein
MRAQNHISTPAATTPRPSDRQDLGQENLGLFRELKLLFAALGAGNSAVPLGDNTRTARMLAEYAASLRR